MASGRHFLAQELLEFGVARAHHARATQGVGHFGGADVRKPLHPLPLGEIFRAGQHRDLQGCVRRHDCQVTQERADFPASELRVTGNLNVRELAKIQAKGEVFNRVVNVEEAAHGRVTHDIGVGHLRDVGLDQAHCELLIGCAHASRNCRLVTDFTFPQARSLFGEEHQGIGLGKVPLHEDSLLRGDVAHAGASLGEVREIFAALGVELVPVLGDLAVNVETDHGEHHEDHAAGH